VEQAARRRLQEQLARLADSDRDAFYPVFVELRPILQRFARRHLRVEDAEDVAQEALVKVFAHAHRFDRERDALSWALGIAAFEIRTARKHRERRREQALEGGPGQASAQAPGPPDPSPNPEQAAIARSLEEAMNEALRGLPPLDAETLRVYARDERTPGVAPATFRKRVERGLARLRRSLGIDAEGNGP
jgi:RNA polymerase sigma factor (sigma-70 family)